MSTREQLNSYIGIGAASPLGAMLRGAAIFTGAALPPPSFSS